MWKSENADLVPEYLPSDEVVCVVSTCCCLSLVSLMAVSPRQCVWVCFSLLVLVLGCVCVDMMHVFAVCLIVFWCFSN